KFEKQRKPASEEDLIRFEQRWEVRLPAVFRCFCREYNGGVPSKENSFYLVPEQFHEFWTEYEVIPDYPIGVRVAWFLSLGDVPEEMTIEKTMRLLTASEQLIADRVP